MSGEQTIRIFETTDYY